MSLLGDQIQKFLEQLARENASEHTLRNYASDLAQFLEYFTPPGADAPEPGQLDKLAFREWMGELHGRKLSAVTIRRKLAAVRSLFNFLHRTGVVPVNVAKRMRTPRAPKTLPNCPSAEQTNDLINAVAEGKLERPFPARDRAIFEMLYGCGCG